MMNWWLILFCPNVVKKNPKFKGVDFLAGWIFHPVVRAIIKFRNHPNISAIRSKFNPQNVKSSSKVNTDDVSTEINKLVNKKSSTEADIVVKLLK